MQHESVQAVPCQTNQTGVYSRPPCIKFNQPAPTAYHRIRAQCPLVGGPWQGDVAQAGQADLPRDCVHGCCRDACTLLLTDHLWWRSLLQLLAGNLLCAFLLKLLPCLLCLCERAWLGCLGLLSLLLLHVTSNQPSAKHVNTSMTAAESALLSNNAG
jgi:hypothetical protein